MEFFGCVIHLWSWHNRTVVYFPCFQASVKQIKKFSSGSEFPKQPKHRVPFTNTGGENALPDVTLSQFFPQDHRFPMPGLLGPKYDRAELEVVPKKELDLFSSLLPTEHQTQILQQAIVHDRMIETDEEYSATDEDPSEIELKAQTCPKVLCRDLQSLFPDRDLMSGDLVVVTITHRTDNDMSSWSSEVDEEREEMNLKFMTSAHEICQSIAEAGFWADFIDPSSGVPFYGPRTNSTLFETDDRYRYFGFEIEDLGCCKVIRHSLWDMHVFVGCIFTSAPLNHPVLQGFVQTVSKD